MSGLHAGPWTTLVVGLSLLTPAAGRAQSWAWVDALGYGGAGVGLGVMSAWDMSYEQGGAVILLASAGGVVLGAVVGHTADARLARGEELGSAHRAAVVAGAVLAGATAGALASAALINGEGGGTPLGSDESTFAALTVGGAALGAAVAWWRRDALRPRPVTLSPSVGPGGGAGLQVRVGF